MKIRKIILLLFMLIIINSLAMESTSKHNPDNTNFAWDLHRVLVDYDLFEMVQNVFANINGLSYLLHPCALYHLLKGALLWGQGGEWGVITEHYPSLAKALIQINNSVQPNEETYQIMIVLDKIGYKQNLASDIEKMSLEELEKKPSMRKIFKILKQKKSVDYTKPNPIFKYNSKYFDDYQAEHNQENKQIIFIDDSEMNIKSANEIGITGILFQNTKQLQNELEKRQILNKDLLT